MAHGGLSAIPGEARPYMGRRAGVVTRTVSAVVDAIVVGVIQVSLYVAACAALFVVDPRGFTFPEPSLAFSLAAALLILVVYLTGAWAFTGRSYGNAVMGTRVVNFRGERVHLVGAFLRAVFCAFVPIGLFWCAVSPRQRSLQDVVLRTSVIYDWQPRPVHQTLGS